MFPKYLLYVIFVYMYAKGSKASEENKTKIPVTPQIFAAFFSKKRLQQKVIINDMKKSTYERTYQLIKIVASKVIDILKEHKQVLQQENYNETLGFPKDEGIQKSLELILHNICLIGDIFLNFQDITYEILKKQDSWEYINWGIYLAETLKEVIDKESIELLSVFREKINNPENLEVHQFGNVNTTPQPITFKKKIKKKIKRGPKLTKIEL